MSRSLKMLGVMLLAFLIFRAGLPAYAGAEEGNTEHPPKESLLDRPIVNESTPNPSTEEPSTENMEVDYWAMLRSLAIVVGLILLAGWLLKKYGKVAGIPVSSDRLRVIGALPLKGANSLYLVELDGRELLVGVADGQISLLKELPSGSRPAEIPLEEPQTGIESGTIEVNTDVSKRKDFSESLKTSIQRQEMENQAKRSESLKNKLSDLIDKSKSLGDLD